VAHFIDVGSGAPIVFVPGIQGRWEWMRPAVAALAQHCRVLVFSLADEPTAGADFDERDGFGSYVRQILDVMDTAGIERATLCGVSYGGLVAAAFAARHPDRVTGLVLVSAIPPSWTPDARARFFLRAPVLLSPLFCLASVRMHREIAAATPGVVRSMHASASQAWRALTHMMSPRRMARRVRLLEGLSLERELAPLRLRTLIVTGEPGLDRVVPVRLTREYLRIWPHATEATLARTGHIGCVTRADEFARIVARFAGANVEAGHQYRLEDAAPGSLPPSRSALRRTGRDPGLHQRRQVVRRHS
jgi:pimeloyl-ACP methyl ester carboxylesterase